MKKIFLGIIVTFLIFSYIGVGAIDIEPMDNLLESEKYFNLFSENISIQLNLNGVSYGHELLWKANTTGTNYEESAVAYLEGVAYIGSCSTHGAGHDKLFAVNTTNGEIIWSTYTGPGYVGPVIDGDVIYIGTTYHSSEDAYIYAINRDTGEIIWKKSIPGGVAESVQYDENKIYFSSSFDNTKIYALNKADGSINWTYDTGLNYCANKPMLEDNALYATHFHPNGELYKLNTTDGSEIWTKTLSAGSWDNSITSDNEGRIFLAIYYDNTMNAYDDNDGSLIWSYELHGGSLSFNAYHNEVIFIADTSGYVYALDSTDGTLLWENKIGDIIDISSPTLSGGLLFIGTRDSNEGAFFVLNETTGDILWKYSVGANVTAPPTIADGMMMCGTDKWYMYAFDFGLGSGNWTLHRYDRHNTAFSPYGLTTWQHIKTNCTTEEDVTTCIVTNYYDHVVTNITLNVPFKGYWYNESGELLKADSGYFNIEKLSSLSSMTIIISKIPLSLNVKIIRPDNSIYLNNKKILSFFVPLLIGKIDIEADVQLYPSLDIERVDFYIDGNYKETILTEPYRWTWNETVFFRHTIKVIAYTKSRAEANDEIKVLKFF